MAQQLKQRILGALITLVALAAVLPVLLEKKQQLEPLVSQVPPMPEIPDWAQVDTEERVRNDLAALASGEAERELIPQDERVVSQDEPAPPRLEGNRTGLDADRKAYAWALQIGAFAESKNANALRDSLRAKGYKAYTQEFPQENLTRVLVGPELELSTTKSLQAKLRKELGQQEIPIKRWQEQ